MFRFCEYFIHQENRYCGKPADRVKSPKLPQYYYLCRSHIMQLDGRLGTILERNEATKKANEVKRLCAYCLAEIILPSWRIRTRLNFCNKTHRALFYYEEGELYKKNHKKQGGLSGEPKCATVGADRKIDQTPHLDNSFEVDGD